MTTKTFAILSMLTIVGVLLTACGNAGAVNEEPYNSTQYRDRDQASLLIFSEAMGIPTERSCAGNSCTWFFKNSSPIRKVSVVIEGNSVSNPDTGACLIDSTNMRHWVCDASPYYKVDVVLAEDHVNPPTPYIPTIVAPGTGPTPAPCPAFVTPGPGVCVISTASG